MKKIVITILSLVFLLSCSGDDNGSSIVVNASPDTPDLVFPINNAVCTNVNLKFDWDAVVDPEGTTVSYLIDIATDADFATVLFTATTTESIQTFNLEKGIQYYWRVKARDSEGNESPYSENQSFSTEANAEVNTIPTVPTVAFPQNGGMATSGTVSLSWDATDADSDTLVYDIYFGETNPPELVTENLTITSFEVSVTNGVQYYWRVAVKDNHQNVTVGQVWNFMGN